MRGRRIAIPLPNTASYRKRGTTYYMRGIIIAAVVLFLLMQLHAFNYTESHDSMMTEPTNDSLDAILSMVPAVLHKFLTPKSRNRTHALLTSLHHNESSVSNSSSKFIDYFLPPNITEIKKQISKYNELQLVLNEETFGPLQNDSVIIVIQVHTRITYLRHLIVSLAQAKDISKSLLIFSHDFYDEDINDLVQSVDFCKVMQIFYPYSIQTHPNEFPGVDADDCPRDMKKEQAIIRKCNNALYPDSYGHYREAKFTQTKHHWWWKANRVFNQLEVTRYHTGLVLFLEEDHYVAEDFIYILGMMQKSTLCPQCNILSLGTYLKIFNYFKVYSSKVEATPWTSSKHNMGFAFNRTTWNSIRKCGEYFCSYDDYNWDWSLQHVSQRCMENKLFTMITKGPRVFHIGECGVHHKKKNCESNQAISNVQQVLNIARKSKQLYPRSLQLTLSSVKKKPKLRKSNGGWGDRRDRELCMNITMQRR